MGRTWCNDRGILGAGPVVHLLVVAAPGVQLLAAVVVHLLLLVAPEDTGCLRCLGQLLLLQLRPAAEAALAAAASPAAPRSIHVCTDGRHQTQNRSATIWQCKVEEEEPGNLMWVLVNE